MDPYYHRAGITIYNGDCLDVMREMPEASVTAVVTDPPYGLSFMGKEWDHGVPGVPFWAEALRVLKPGGHALIFGGTRTYHRLACAVEDAGFEIRDCLSWLYGSGFPKSLDVSKAIDKAAGAERKKIGTGKGRTGAAAQPNGGSVHSDDNYQWPGEFDITTPATEAAQLWHGWGTALKPAWEPIILARKPLAGTVAANALEHGVAGLNVDGCRIGSEVVTTRHTRCANGSGSWQGNESTGATSDHQGRWPANLVLDEEAAAMVDEQSGFSTSTAAKVSEGFKDADPVYGGGHPVASVTGANDSGGASRFFYTAKADKADRNGGGLDGSRLVLYAPPLWVNEVLQARLPEATARSLRRAIEESTIQRGGDSAWSTCWCGSAATDPCHPDISSIIETETHSTIAWETSSASRRPHTNGCIAAAFSSVAFGGSLAGSAESSSPWGRSTGIYRGKGGPSTGDADLATSVESWLTSKPAGGGHVRVGSNTHPT